MKKIYLFAVAAVMFAACSSNEDLSQDVQQQTTTAEQGAIAFDAYIQRATTRAGVSGDVTIDKLKGVASTYEPGFGVFGYYTDNNNYDQMAIPNFMYNEQVKWNGTYWTYEPIKYWPNEYGANATSDDQDKVTFFAYAPWVDVDASTGKIKAPAEQAKWGITGMSRNSATGDPLIKYIVSFTPDEMVDLCWGVCDNPQWSVIQGNIQQINLGVTGKPWIDVQRPSEAATQAAATTSKLKFQFKHALAQLNVQIDADPDIASHDESSTIAEHTKVFVRSITFSGIATKGALNLNNETPNKARWMDYNGTADLESGQEITIQDGRKDGKEGASGAEANNELAGLNTTIIQSTEWASNPTGIGVTKDPKNLFKVDGVTAPIYVIPTGEDVKVTIVYDIETKSDNLANYVSDGKTHGSSIENRISKSINFGSVTSMENGKKYTIKLHLGMNSVKFDAEVTAWDNASVSTPDIDLPANVPSFASTTSGGPYGVSIAGDAAKYVFAVSGLTGNEAVTKANTGSVSGVKVSSTGNFSSDDSKANASGVTYVEATVTALTAGVLNVDNDAAITITGDHGNKVIINLTQLALPLNLQAPASGTGRAAKDTDIKYTYTSNAATGQWQVAGSDATACSIYVWVNGVQLTEGSTTPNTGEFTFDDGELTLGDETHDGDVVTITIKTGDAPSETVSFVVGS